MCSSVEQLQAWLLSSYVYIHMSIVCCTQAMVATGEDLDLLVIDVVNRRLRTGHSDQLVLMEWRAAQATTRVVKHLHPVVVFAGGVSVSYAAVLDVVRLCSSTQPEKIDNGGRLQCLSLRSGSS